MLRKSTLSRRQSIGWLAGLVGAASSAVRADDLLLDPSQVFRKTQPSVQSPPSAQSASGRGAGYGRSMADSVVDSMDTLTRGAADRADEVERLAKRIAELGPQLAALRQKMESVLDEYRRGQFCSGCGKTRSEILAAGQTFPHPGQTVIRATPEQIAAKEREMQAPIDRGDKELKDDQARRGKALAEREEALAQIDAGLSLWTTSISFEGLALDAQQSQIEANYKAEKEKLEQQLSAARMTKPAPGDGAVARTTQRLNEQLTQLANQRSSKLREVNGARTNAANRSSRDEDMLNGYLSRGALKALNISQVSSSGQVAQNAGFNALGGMYRMGAFDTAHRDETLPRVESFIADFRQLPSSPTRIQPTPAPATNSLRDKLKELLKCDPAQDASCGKPARNGGSGIRG